MIQVHGLSHSFGERRVLRDVSFGVGKGEFVLLTGPSGAGKTTLLRLLHGSLRMNEGRAAVAGYDLGGLSGERLAKFRRQVTCVFQDFRILPERSVYENVSLPLKIQGVNGLPLEKQVAAVLGALRLDDLARVKCEELSGGEQQRVAMARAIVVSPKLLLADEPTGNLDWELAGRLIEVFRQFNSYGTTIFMATHNLEIVAKLSEARLLKLVGGQVKEAA